MKVFRLLNTEDKSASPDQYASTLANVKALARVLPSHVRKEFLVEELDVQTDKEGVVAMLNDAPITKLLRSFEVTPRGGLKEI